MAQTVDVRGLSCPQPVIVVKKAIDKGEFPLTVLLDAMVACENVKRMAESIGYSVSVEEKENEFLLDIKKGTV